jgi:hypothetical protein
MTASPEVDVGNAAPELLSRKKRIPVALAATQCALRCMRCPHKFPRYI